MAENIVEVSRKAAQGRRSRAPRSGRLRGVLGGFAASSAEQQTVGGAGYRGSGRLRDAPGGFARKREDRKDSRNESTGEARRSITPPQPAEARRLFCNML